MISVIISLIILILHLTKIFILFAKQDMLTATIGIITIGTGILGTIFGIEIAMIKMNFIFCERTRDNTYINSLLRNEREGAAGCKDR